MTTSNTQGDTPPIQPDDLEARIAKELKHTLKLVPQSQRELFTFELARWHQQALERERLEAQEHLCGNASDNLYLTFKGGCREVVTLKDVYRCTGCGGRFHKDCIFKHFELEKDHDWGRQEERRALAAQVLGIADGCPDALQEIRRVCTKYLTTLTNKDKDNKAQLAQPSEEKDV